MRTRFYLHVVLWCALFGVFIARGLPIIVPAIRENKIGPIEQDHSTDSYLSGLTHIRGGTELCGTLIDTLPRDKTVIILVDAGNSPSEFLGMLVAYLSWPLDVQIVLVRPSIYWRELAAIKNTSVSSVIFCALKPPVSIKNKINFGSSITLVPIESLNFNQ